VRSKGSVAFVHPCCQCGNPVAPFGVDAYVLRAIRAHNPKLAGRWYCAEHRPEEPKR
jgi:hypothetical protein